MRMMLKLMAISPAQQHAEHQHRGASQFEQGVEPAHPVRIELHMLDPRPPAQFRGELVHGRQAFVGCGQHEGVGKRVCAQGFDHLTQPGVGLHSRQGFFARQKLDSLDVARFSGAIRFPSPSRDRRLPP
jgi:hypothetical protein